MVNLMAQMQADKQREF